MTVWRRSASNVAESGIGLMSAITESERPHSPTGILRQKKSREDVAGVYTLQDAHGRVYVGKSFNVNKRIAEHMQGSGTTFLSNPHTGLTQLQTATSGSKNDLESWERAETLTQMYSKGIRNVRGWMFTTSSLSEQQVQDAFGQICEKFDLCRRCGRNSHFISQCFANTKAQWVSK